MATGRAEQLTFWDLGKQQVTVDFQGGQISGCGKASLAAPRA
jgi:hypothetical protein